MRFPRSVALLLPGVFTRAVRARPQFYSSFLTLHFDTRLQTNNVEWIESYFRTSTAVQIKHVTIAETAYGVAYPVASGQALYPSGVPGFNPPTPKGHDTVANMLQAADSVGLDVSLGLLAVTNGACMPGYFSNRTAASLSSLAAAFTAFATDLHQKYGHHASLKGMYIGSEPAAVCFATGAAQSALATTFLEPVASHIKSLGLIASVAPLFVDTWGHETPDSVGAFWHSVLSQTPSLGRLELQDKVSQTPLVRALPFIAAVSAAAKANGIAMWSDVELFRNQANGTEVAAAFDEVKEQLSQEAADVAGFTNWCYNCWMDPYKDGTKGMYHSYAEYVGGSV